MIISLFTGFYISDSPHVSIAGHAIHGFDMKTSFSSIHLAHELP